MTVWIFGDVCFSTLRSFCLFVYLFALGIWHTLQFLQVSSGTIYHQAHNPKKPNKRAFSRSLIKSKFDTAWQCTYNWFNSCYAFHTMQNECEEHATRWNWGYVDRKYFHNLNFQLRTMKSCIFVRAFSRNVAMHATIEFASREQS